LESADFTLKLTLYALFAWGASILIAAIPTNSKVAYRIQWLVVRGITIVGALCTFIGFLSVFGVTSKAWGWPWYLSMLSTMMYVGVMSMAQWSAMKLTKGIWFDDKQPPK
jgi:hypothetical protein